jgi:peptide deformylase
MNSPQPDLTSKANPASEGRQPRRRRPPLTLVYYPDPMLRKVCVPVERFDSTLEDIADEMTALMQSHAGIGLAAPQVGLEYQFLVCGIESQLITLANAQIQESSQMGEFVEGCLSLPDIRVKVTRPERIRVSGYDVHGQRRSFAATGLWARVIQHELDHLNGVLICDYGRPLAEGCEKCPLALPTVLVEERKHQSQHPRSH